MQFNSYIFILAFLPLFVIGYHLLCKLHALAGKIWIIVAGIVFYCYHGWSAAALLGSSILVNLLLSYLIKRFGDKNRNSSNEAPGAGSMATSRVSSSENSNNKTKKSSKVGHPDAQKPGHPGAQRALLVVIIVLNILLLLYFKYFNFGIAITNDLFHTSFAMREIIMPLGISFFTFQQIMYVLAIYRKELPTVNIPDYLAYILYFPKLVMGPLAEPADLIGQINDPALKHVSWQNIAGGLKLFACGLFKKMVLADTFSHAVAWGFANIDTATSGDFFLVMLFYTFEIYFDFSGYTDMATGVSLMINITLPINFDSPYKAVSIRDFWKRWHISLTTFFTKDLYIPLGGSRKGTARTFLNIMIVFLVSGLWHGANWTFLLWGCLHGILQILERIFDKARGKLMEAVRWFLTFGFVNVLWLLFRADSIGQWTSLMWKMFSFQNLYVSDGLIETFKLPEHGFFMDLLHLHSFDAGIRGLSMVLFIAGAFILCLIPGNCYRNRQKLNPANLILCAIAFVWGFLCLSSESVFVYFNF